MKTHVGRLLPANVAELVFMIRGQLFSLQINLATNTKPPKKVVSKIERYIKRSNMTKPIGSMYDISTLKNTIKKSSIHVGKYSTVQIVQNGIRHVWETHGISGVLVRSIHSTSWWFQPI